MVLLASGAYVSISFILVRIGRVESAEKLRQAVRLEEQGWPLEALDAYQYSSRFEANPTDTFLTMSRLERRIGRPNRALDHAQTAVGTASPGQEISARLALARAYSELGQWSDARQTYQDTLEKNDRCAEANQGRAMTSRELGDFRSMVDALSSLRDSTLEGSSREFVEAYGVAQRRIAATKDRIAARGESALDLYAQAMNQFDLGRWDECVDSITQAVTFSDAPADAWYWFGVAAEVDGDSDLAIDRYERTLEQLPDHLRAGQRLTVLNETGR